MFNGEAYNFLELKRELEARGAAFRSSSDTEVLLEMLELEGQQALVRLDAMFALGCYDTERGELLLARDIFGEKPLYYVDHENYFAFASELHSLANLPGFDARIDRSAIAS
jgi:asparagine synthase (glutamine-hydrolysing)